MVMRRTNMMRRNLRQTIIKSLGRYIAIMAIVALGAGLFCGLRVTKVDMLATVQKFTDSQNMFDLQVMNSYGWTDRSVESLSQLPGIADAEGSVSLDTLIHFGDNDEQPYKAMSLPETVNQASLMEGRMPEAPNECVIDGFYFGQSILGKQVHISANNDEDTADSFAYDTYTIVGTVNTPLYLNMQRGSTTIGSGSLKGFFYIPREGFDVDYYTEINLTMQGEFEVYSDTFNDAMDDMADILEPAAREEANVRWDEIIAEAQEAYDEGMQEYLDGIAEYREAEAEVAQELADALAELTDGQAEIDENRKKLEDGRKELDAAQKTIDTNRQEIENAKQTLEDSLLNSVDQMAQARAELDKNYEQVSDGLFQVNDGLAQIENGLAQIDDGIAQIDDGLAQIEEAIPQLEDGIAQIDDGLVQLDDGIAQLDESIASLEEMLSIMSSDDLEEQLADLKQQRADYAQQREDLQIQRGQYVAQLEELKQQKQDLTAQRADLVAQRAELVAQQEELLKTKAELEDAMAQIEEGYAQIEDGTYDVDEMINRAIAEIEDGQRQLDEAQAEVDKQRLTLEDGEKELADAEQELADGWQEYYDGKEEAEQELADAWKELSDARLDLAEAREDIASIEKPALYTLTRNTNLGYVVFESDSDIVAGVAKIFPVFFLAVAALVCITTMTRMVDEERTQIGILKALGYSGSSIMSKYLLYSGSASLLGCLLGLALGSTVFPRIIWYAYCIMYDFSDQLTLSYDPFSIAFIFLSYTGLILLVTWNCCRRELKDVPAELIRPKPPVSGKQILLEKLPLWRHLKFLTKVAVRNIFRYRQRLAMMLLGIGGCTALLVTGFGLGDSIAGVVSYQYDYVNVYDIGVTFDEELDEAAQAQFRATYPEQGIHFCYQGGIDLEFDNSVKNVYFIATDESLEGFIGLRQDGVELPMPGENETLISIGAATAMGIEAGDQVTLRNSDMEELTLTVSGIYDNNVYNYAIVTGDTVRSQWGRDPEIQTAFVLSAEGQEVHELGAALASYDGVLGMTINQDTADTVGSMMEAMDAIILVVVICAGALAGIVLYNLTNINIQERIREIATIKVLGFNAGETGSYVFKENLTLTVVGTLLGLFAGKWLHALVMSYVRIDMVWFDNVIEPMSYVLAAVLTIVAALIVDFVMYFKLDKINMAEALKSVE